MTSMLTLIPVREVRYTEQGPYHVFCGGSFVHRRSHIGDYLFAFHQCARCGGTWFLPEQRATYYRALQIDLEIPEF